MALDSLATAFGVWLDSDDELIPGRSLQLCQALIRQGADIAYDEINLHEGQTGEFLKRLKIPSFLQGSKDMIRNFGRNYIPGLGVPAFRTECARSIGFDPSFHGAEDYDFLLRAVITRHKFCLVRSAGYRQFSYHNSISRNIDNQRYMCARALRKHNPHLVRRRLSESGIDLLQSTWTFIEFLISRGDYQKALEELEALEKFSIQEGDQKEIWRRRFQEGTIHLLLGNRTESLAKLSEASAALIRPESLNNLGVNLVTEGANSQAEKCFNSALELSPNYHDAMLNKHKISPPRITALPLRDFPSRNNYKTSE